jgi:hypothetical protein
VLCLQAVAALGGQKVVATYVERNSTGKLSRRSASWGEQNKTQGTCEASRPFGWTCPIPGPGKHIQQVTYLQCLHLSPKGIELYDTFAYFLESLVDFQLEFPGRSHSAVYIIASGVQPKRFEPELVLSLLPPQEKRAQQREASFLPPR